jgi:hypothetical protein
MRTAIHPPSPARERRGGLLDGQPVLHVALLHRLIKFLLCRRLHVRQRVHQAGHRARELLGAPNHGRSHRCVATSRRQAAQTTEACPPRRPHHARCPEQHASLDSRPTAHTRTVRPGAGAQESIRERRFAPHKRVSAPAALRAGLRSCPSMARPGSHSGVGA